MRPIAYLLWEFPVLTETFIFREIEGLLNQGVQIQIYVLHKPQENDLICKYKEQWKELLIYHSLFKSLFFHLCWFFKMPRRYVYAFSAMIKAHTASLLEFRRGLKIWLMSGDLAWSVAEKKIKHIHAHFGSLPTSAALGISSLVGISYSFSAHARDIYVPDTNLVLKMRRAEFILVCSRYGLNQLAKLAPKSKHKLILHYHGISIHKIDQQCMVMAQYPPLILSVGRLTEKKGFIHLINACKLLKDLEMPFTLKIIGDGKEKTKLKEQVTATCLSKQVEFLGVLAPEEVNGWYPKATVVVVPSQRAANNDMDSIPNVILEALINHRPVIASDISGIPEVIHPGETGILVPPNDPASLASAIMWVMNNPKAAVQLANRGHDLVHMLFDLNESSKRLKGILQRIN